MFKKKRIIKHTIVLVILIGIFIFVSRDSISDKYIAKKRVSNLKSGFDVISDKEWEENLKKEPSEITGKTLYDLYEMGLIPRDGADSDFDGLSDKDEFEIYHTDPLKASTSGDLYSDGYKVEHNMDLNTYYEYTDKQVYEYNTCKEVELSALSPTDFFAVIKEVTELYNLEKYKLDNIYKGYDIYNFGGKMQIDLSDIPNDDIDLSKLEIYIFEGDPGFAVDIKPQKTEYSLNENIALIDYDFDENEEYFLYIVEKLSFKEKLINFVKNTLQKNTETFMSEELGDLGIEPNEQSEDNEFIIQGPVLLGIITTFFGYDPLRIYYKKDISEKTLSMATAKRSKEFEYERKCPIWNKTKVKIEKFRFDFKKFLFTKTPLKMFVWDGTSKGQKFRHLLYIAYLYNPTEDNAITAEEDDDIEANGDIHHYNTYSRNQRRYKHYHTKFWIYRDELEFQNFGSEYHPEGNCAGISHLTAFLYNNKYFPSSGNYNGLKWDLTTDKDNLKLTTEYLIGYKTWDWVDNNSEKYSNYLINERLTAGEKEFVKMIAANNQENNDRIKLNDYMGADYIRDPDNYDWSTILKVLKYMDQDKVVECGIYFQNGNWGHEIVLTDYWWDKYGNLYFGVYDPNFPGDDIENVVMTNERNILKVKRFVSKTGQNRFLYMYQPIAKNSYTASNCEFSKCAIVFFDSDYNVFNTRTATQ